jgi:hypothetical protein
MVHKSIHFFHSENSTNFGAQEQLQTWLVSRWFCFNISSKYNFPFTNNLLWVDLTKFYLQFVEYLSAILRKRKDSFNSLVAGNVFLIKNLVQMYLYFN